MTVILVVGDTHGHFDLLVEHIEAASRHFGPLDAVVAVGDFLPSGDGVPLPDPLPSFDVPVSFIGGNHEPWLALDQLDGTQLAPGLRYLGRVGVCDVEGLRVAFLSGIHGAAVSDRSAADRRSFKERRHWVREELDQLISAASDESIDLLMTHEWPLGFAEDRYGVPVGSADVARLSAHLGPRLHVCGHMHLRRSGVLAGVAVEAAGFVPDGCVGSFVTRWDDSTVAVDDPWPDSDTPEVFVRRASQLRGKSARRFTARTSRTPIT